MKEIPFEDLSIYTPWVNRIIGIEDFQIHHKNKSEIIREFDKEKWGAILKENSSPSLYFADNLIENFDTKVPFYLDGKFYIGSGLEVFKKHIDIFEKELKSEIVNASALVELGAGYGSKILNIGKRKAFQKVPLFAAEFTKNGIKLMSKIAKKENKNLEVGFCDFEHFLLQGINIPENAIIFTSYSLHYIPKLNKNFFNFIKQIKPKVVFHFEPCYEYYSDLKLFGLMCQRYTQLNDYNINMATIFENNKEINYSVYKNKIGSNPFLPISIIKWNFK